MAQFDDREHAFEARFAHDAERRFKALWQRDKMLGEWAAQLMGRTGDSIESYARDVAKSDLKAPGDADVFRKVRDDLTAAGVEISDRDIETKMRELLAVASEKIT